jgi:spore coat polysaccharide biosynthesis predicted glycosyltransferase SpsG
MIFLGLKGFGDLTILISYLNKCEESHTVIIRSGLEQLINNLLIKKHDVKVLRSIKDIFPLYSLKKISLKNIYIIILGGIEIRKIINKKDDLILDFKYTRNSIFFLGLKKKYLCSNTSIYSGYRQLFDINIAAKSLTGSESNILAFPLGSTKEKYFTNRELIQSCKEKNINIELVTVILFQTHSAFVKEYKEFKVSIYHDMKELFKLIRGCDAIISIDTFHLHLAVNMQIPLLTIGFVNQNFIPPYKN